MAKIVTGTTRGGSIGTSTKNTGITQRETLERIIINLSTCLEIKEVHKMMSAREALFYEPQGVHMCYQSATNTILELSELLLNKIK